MSGLPDRRLILPLVFLYVCRVGSSQVHQVQSRSLLRVRPYLVYLILSLEHMADMFICFV
ncbi:hypothetical protein BC828DRAFT_122175 [Blastocladiella britannica]|nr:hypothetical protein BC828DRAFT_122175 [Blastocladiella britannica]